jgi:hypothetical protein
VGSHPEQEVIARRWKNVPPKIISNFKLHRPKYLCNHYYCFSWWLTLAQEPILRLQNLQPQRPVFQTQFKVNKHKNICSIWSSLIFWRGTRHLCLRSLILLVIQYYRCSWFPQGSFLKGGATKAEGRVCVFAPTWHVGKCQLS